MIYISSSCIKSKLIKNSVFKLATYGFKNIELSGGTDFYNNYINDLIELKNQFGLTYLIHNYFPPPKDHFVLNLASLDDDIFNKTINHFKKSIEAAKVLGVNKIGLHAGFLIDPSVSELGNPFKTGILNDRVKAIDRFCKGYNQILEFAGDIEVYIENNVISQRNFSNFGMNPFLLTNYEAYLELKKIIDFPLLFDVAHLKVSCNTLNLNFRHELEQLFSLSDYIHISNNDGFTDSNKNICNNSELIKLMKKLYFKNKTVTIETYCNIGKISTSHSIIEDLFN